ncbi:DUF302 domain-containing protein [Methylovirgula sp. 4M-Z18]|nr:DUF302 domain-containing protein [Methylovirgula sp. 4M-Z18]
MTREIAMPFDGVIDAVSDALATKGFEIIASIDVQALMKNRVGAVIKPHTVLFACNPHLVWRALQIEGKVGPLLPINVIVREKQGEYIEIAIADPVSNECDIDDIRLRNVATGVRRLLEEVLNQLCPEETPHT